MEYISIAIASVSILLSFYAVRLGRKNRSYDLLFKFYEELRLKEPAEAKDMGDIIPPEDEEMNEDDQFIYRYNSSQKQEHVEAKFNLLCFAVIKKQIPLDDFFALFGQYLQARKMFWPTQSSHRIGNYPYTSRVINICIRKGLLPLSKNYDFKYNRLGKLKNWEEGSLALKALQEEIHSRIPKNDNSLPQE